MPNETEKLLTQRNELVSQIKDILNLIDAWGYDFDEHPEWDIIRDKATKLIAGVDKEMKGS